MKTINYKNKRVLVTGGAGFIGSNLAAELVKQGAKVTIVDSMLPDYGGNLYNLREIEDKVHVNFADIRGHGMQYLVQNQDVIFNLAGQVSHIDSVNDPEADLAINCEAQLHILEAVRHHNPDATVVYASTRQIYGKPQYLPVDEAHPVSPMDINGINKAAGESYHTLYHVIHGLKTVSLRLTNTYGPHQLVKHNRQGFIGWFTRLVVEGKEIQIYGDGAQRRDLTYVSDVVDAFLLAGQKPEAIGQVYNLAHPDPISLKDLVEVMIDVAGQGSYKLIPWPPEKKKIDIGDYYGAAEKIKRELGWEPRVSVRDGLTQSIAFYKAHGKEYGVEIN